MAPNFPKFPKNAHILDLGCGPKERKYPGAVGFDALKLDGVDVVGDINKKLPFKPNTFDVVIMNSILEHVDNVQAVLKEVHRILKPGGIVFIHVPFFRRNTAFGDPTHKHFFTHMSMCYFVEGHKFSYYSDFKFEQVERKLIFCRTWRLVTIPAQILQWFANTFPEFYENHVSAFLPARNLEWLLKKI